MDIDNKNKHSDNTVTTPGINKPFVSIVVPGYNEAHIIEKNLQRICEYMVSLEEDYEWELIFVNDGSTDETGELAEKYARGMDRVYVLNHFINFRLGQALRYAFSNCRGDYIVVLDVDLSYSPDHIEKLLNKIRESRAKIVISSPYMKDGKVSNVPWLRRVLSKWANKYLSLFAYGNITTLTGMVRAYDARFLRTLHLKAMDTEINEEIIYKAQLMSAHILEIPAHLDWGPKKGGSAGRRSSMKIVKKIATTLFSGFNFRPVTFFIVPGFLLILLSLYPIAWTFIHTLKFYLSFPESNDFLIHGFSHAITAAFLESPQSFFFAGLMLLLALQLISLGFLALQNKRYFEEMFNLGTSIYKQDREMK